jgi:hypothetical protein
VFASGMAAVHAALAAVLRAGDRVLATTAIYGSTRSLLVNQFGRLGVTTAFVDATDLAAVDAALAAAPTRLLYVETISNPTIVVADVAALAAIAHRHGALLIVDNTFASPYLCRPIELGADLVVESATKFIGGHSDVLAGLVAGSARADQGRPPGGDRHRRHAVAAVRLSRPARPGHAGGPDGTSVGDGPGAGGLAGDGAGGPASPATRGCPAIPSMPWPSASSRSAAGCWLSRWPVAGPAGGAFIDALTIPELTASLGSIHTIIAHPPTTTHRQLSDAELAQAGIAPGLLRCSVGLEDLDDLRPISPPPWPRPRLPPRRPRVPPLRPQAVAPDRRPTRRRVGGPDRHPGGRPSRLPRDQRLSPPARLGLGLWRLFTSVNFAVLQIMILVVVGLIGMTVSQLPDFAFRTPADYIAQMEIIHAKYDPGIGSGAVAVLERLQIFNIFTAWWFSALLVLLVTSIIVCTLNRTPKLWRTSAEIRVIQPDPFYNPILPDRAAISGIDVAAVRAALRRSGLSTFARPRWTGSATYTAIATAGPSWPP